MHKVDWRIFVPVRGDGDAPRHRGGTRDNFLGGSVGSERWSPISGISRKWIRTMKSNLPHLGRLYGSRGPAVQGLRLIHLRPNIIDQILVNVPGAKAYVSYCTLSGGYNIESWLRGLPAPLALENSILVQWFVQTATDIVVTVLFQ